VLHHPRSRDQRCTAESRNEREGEPTKGPKARSLGAIDGVVMQHKGSPATAR
jgi:hypothetical protein